jgi:hypothetical protein
MKNEDLIGDLSTIDGLSIYGDDLDLNIQRRFKNESDYDMDSDIDEDCRENHYLNQIIRRSMFSEFNDDPMEEDKYDPKEETKFYPVQP